MRKKAKLCKNSVAFKKPTKSCKIKDGSHEMAAMILVIINLAMHKTIIKIDIIAAKKTHTDSWILDFKSHH